MATMTHRLLASLQEELDGLRAAGLLRRRREVVSLGDGWCRVEGRRLRNFAANDYLNLAHDPRVVAAARAALDECGAGAGASALVTGRSAWHVRLEERLAAFEGREAALLFPSGYAANVGTIPALARPQDVVFCDRLNHASLIDGCRLSGARFRVYRHDQLDRLERELGKAAGHRRRWIVTDSVFSMDGHLAPLPALCDLAERFDAGLIVDEAHATGVLGTDGRGAAELLGVEDRVTVRIGTLSKAVGSLGGFVAGPRPLIDWLVNAARTQIFSTALPPSACAAALTALEIIQREPLRRQHLLARSEHLRQQLTAQGSPLPAGGCGPILPVILGDADRTVAAAARLEAAGLLVPAIRPPTVPSGTSRLRISLSAVHTEEDIDALCQVFGQAVVGNDQ